MEGHRRAADELDAEVHTAHADDNGDKHHRAAGHGEEDLLKPQKVDVELDEAAAHVFAGSGLLHALEVRHSLDAVLHTPELGMLRDELRGEKADERRLEQHHHDDVAHNAQSKRHAEALDRSARQEEQRERGDERHEVGVDRGQDAVADARDGRGAHASTHAYFLAEALERQDGGVGRHADGQNDAGDARHRKAEQAECGKQREDAQVNRRKHGHCRRGDDAEPFVEHEEVNHNDHKADERHEHAGLQRILAERRADDLALRVLEAHGQRAGLEHGLHLLGRVERIAASDGDVAVGDDRLHGGSGLHLTVEDNDDLALGGSEVFSCLGEGLRALGVKAQVNRIVGRGLGSLAHVDLLEVRAGDDRRVRALFDLEVLHLLTREGIAERIGHRALRAVLAVLDLRLHIGIGKGVKPRELELARLADGIERFLGVGQAGDLHEDLVVALNLHDRLGCAKGIHAVLDNRAGRLHVLSGNIRPVVVVRREHDRKATLNVEALIDLFLRRREHHDRADDQKRHDHEQPYVAPILIMMLLLFLRFRHVPELPYFPSL